MNPLKCAFGVSSDKFLGFTIQRKGTNIDPTKPKAIQDIKSLMTYKRLDSWEGSLMFVNSFRP